MKKTIIIIALSIVSVGSIGALMSTSDQWYRYGADRYEEKHESDDHG